MAWNFKKIGLAAVIMTLFVITFFILLGMWVESDLKQTETYKIAYDFSMKDSLLTTKVGPILSAGSNVRGQQIRDKVYVSFDIECEIKTLRVYFEFELDSGTWIIKDYYTKE